MMEEIEEKEQKERKDPKRFVFTEKRVRDIEPPPKEKKKERYYDERMPGLSLIVTPAGKKTFAVYKKVNGKTKTISIDISPSITVDTARLLAQEIMVKLARGEDPVKSDKLKWTLEEWLAKYVKDKSPKPATEKQYRNALKNYSPQFYQSSLMNISGEAVLSIYKKICNGSLSWTQDNGDVYKMKKGSPSQANLWARTLRAVFRYAIQETETETTNSPLIRHPISIISRRNAWVKIGRKHSRIRDAHISMLINAIDTVLVDSLVTGLESRAAFCDQILFALFTGLRKSEIQGLTWDRVRISDRYFWIEQTKNGETIQLPITKTLEGIFKRRADLCGNNPFVFGIENEKVPALDERKTIKAIVCELETMENMRALYSVQIINPDVYKSFTMHDLRRTYASIAFLQFQSDYLIKRLLNHTVEDNDPTTGYLSATADELRPFTNKIEGYMLNESKFSEDNTYPIILDRILKRTDHYTSE